MLSFVRSLSLCCLAFSDVIHAYATPLACSGICGNSHDPSVIRRTSDGKYFRFSTGNKISVATANSLSGPWVSKGSALPAGSKINKKGNNDLWAPDVSKVGDLYYLLYSVSSFGSQDSAIGYATSKDMESWADQGTTGIESTAGSSFNAIDGNLVVDGGTAHLAFGSFWSDIFISYASINSGILKASTSNAKQLIFTSTAPQAIEGAFLFRYGDFWYIFFSEGQCCGLDTNRPAAGKEYRIKMCRSKNVNSGFVDKGDNQCKAGGGSTLLKSHTYVFAPGGQGALNDSVEGPVIYYHYSEFSSSPSIY
ncbi:gb [Venturia nashicola]|nr:gb [Venturia nashicola]